MEIETSKKDVGMSWEMVRLGDVATFVNGYPFKPTDWGIEGYEIIRIQNLTKGTLESNYFSGSIPEKFKVTDGDVLISWSATLDIFVWKGNDAWLNQHIFKVVFDKIEIDKSYFIYAIKNILDEMRKQVHGATMQHITKGKFDNLQIPLPPLATQKRIAEILDAADALRRKDQELLKKYDELAQAIFIDMFGDPVKNEKGWEVKTIGSITKVGSGGTPSRQVSSYFNGSIPWVKTTEVNGEIITSTEELISDEALKNSSCKLYPKNSVIIAMYGQGKTRGQVALLGIEAATNQACGVIQPCAHLNPKFLFNYLKFSYSEIRNLGRGGNQENLNKGMIEDYNVMIPPLELQEEFNRIIENLLDQKSSSKIVKSESLFNSLLQKAFKGELV